MIEMQNLSFGYSGGDPLLADMTLSLQPGSFHFLTGPSGAGKTTFLRLCYAELLPTSGRMTAFGQDVTGLTRDGIAGLRRRVGVVHQDTQFLDHLPVAENLALPLMVSGAAIDMAALGDLLAWVQLSNHARAMPPELSGGERQRAWLSMMVAQQAGTLLLDEPISALDIAHAVEVLSLVRRMCQTQGLTAVIVLHEVNMAARFCDHIVALKGGRLALQGTPADLMRADALQAIYGLPMEVLTRADGQLITVPA